MHDLVIRSGTIVDGTGTPSFAGDLAIRDGKIVEFGERPVQGGGKSTPLASLCAPALLIPIRITMDR